MMQKNPSRERAAPFLSWVSHPLREEPKRSWIIVLFAVLAGAAVYVYARDWFWVAFGEAILLIGVRDWFLPTRFTLDETGATRRSWLFTRFKSWEKIQRLEADLHGVLLSPYPTATFLDPLRGLYLRFSNNRGAVMDCLREIKQLREQI